MKTNLIHHNVRIRTSSRHAKYFAASMLVALLIVIAIAATVMVCISWISS